MSMWGTPKNFCLAFIDELEKQQLKKKVGQENVRILILMLH